MIELMCLKTSDQQITTFISDEKNIKVKFNSDDDLTWIAWRNNNCQVYFQWLQEILSVNFLRYIFVQISMVQYKCGVW